MTAATIVGGIVLAGLVYLAVIIIAGHFLDDDDVS